MVEALSSNLIILLTIDDSLHYLQPFFKYSRGFLFFATLN